MKSWRNSLASGHARVPTALPPVLTGQEAWLATGQNLVTKIKTVPLPGIEHRSSGQWTLSLLTELYRLSGPKFNAKLRSFFPLWDYDLSKNMFIFYNHCNVFHTRNLVSVFAANILQKFPIRVTLFSVQFFCYKYTQDLPKEFQAPRALPVLYATSLCSHSVPTTGDTEHSTVHAPMVNLHSTWIIYSLKSWHARNYVDFEIKSMGQARHQTKKKLRTGWIKTSQKNK